MLRMSMQSIRNQSENTRKISFSKTNDIGLEKLPPHKVNLSNYKQ